MRPCRRTACASPASASLIFRYDTAQAWLEDLSRESEPQRWDLCRPHASMLTVPVGWELLDVRSEGAGEAPPAAEPASAAETPATTDRGERDAARPGRRDGPARHRRRPNRYAELSARLPALAAEVAARSRWSGPPHSPPAG